MIGPPLDSARGPRALPGRPSSCGRGERGAVSWVTLLLLVIVVGGSYLAWVWVPIYFDDYAVKQVVRDYMNQAVRNGDDDALRRNMVQKIRLLRDQEALDEYGRTVRVPCVPLDERDVTWERDSRSQPPMLRVSFEYEREVEYPWLDRTATKVFAVDLTNEMVVPNWGPPR